MPADKQCLKSQNIVGYYGFQGHNIVKEQIQMERSIVYSLTSGLARAAGMLFLFLFLFGTGFHNHAIHIGPCSDFNIEATGHGSDPGESIEFCSAHTAQNGMDKTDRIINRITVSISISRIQSSNVSVSDLTTICRRSPRSPPAA